MTAFKIYGLGTEEVSKVKEARHDAYGNVPEASQALSNASICRRCLRRFKPGDGRILFKYRPFKKESVFAEAGPIFVHEPDCRPTAEPLTDYPEEFRSMPLVLRAYDHDDRQVVAELIRNGEAETTIGKFFANPEVAYIHLRDGEYGCYVARIERGA
jgi:hypothetical protein